MSEDEAKERVREEGAGREHYKSNGGERKARNERLRQVELMEEGIIKI